MFGVFLFKIIWFIYNYNVSLYTKPKTMNVTELEKQVLINIKDSEYQDGSPLNNSWVWSFSVTNETKQLAGALGSCVKKGLAQCYKDFHDDETCSLTQEGVEYLKSIGKL